MADRCALVKGFSLDACCGGSTCSSCCVVCKPPLVKPVPPPNHNESVAVRWCCCRDGSSCSHSSWIADASCSEFRPSKGTQTFIELWTKNTRPDQTLLSKNTDRILLHLFMIIQRDSDIGEIVHKCFKSIFVTSDCFMIF